MNLKRINFFMSGLLFGLLSCSTAPKTDRPLRVWYNQPANSAVADIKEGWANDPEWLKALPLGNGFIGADQHDFARYYDYRLLPRSGYSNAVASVRYRCKGIQFKREAMISHPDKVMLVKICADKKQSISFEAGLYSKLKFRIISQSNDYLILRGKAPKYVAARNTEPEQIVYDAENGKFMEPELFF